MNRLFKYPRSIAKHVFCMIAILAAWAAQAQNANWVANGAAVRVVANGAVNLVLKDANYVNNASAAHFSGTASTVRITGAGGGTVVASGSFATTFGNMVMNRPAGLSLSVPVNVASVLTMQSGNINTTATNLLTVGTSAAVPGSVSWTAGTIIGPLKRFYTAAAQTGSLPEGIFPVGNSSYNRYARVNFTANPGGGFIIAEYKTGIPALMGTGLPATINGQLINNYEDEGWWSITPTGGNLNTTSYNLFLRGNTLSTPNSLPGLRIIKSSNHTAWNDNPAGDGNHVGASGSLTDFTIGATAMMGFSWFNIGSDNSNPLPVALTSLAATCNDQASVDVIWETGSEHNSQHFTVEKSRNLSHWTWVSELPAAGNSTTSIAYQFTDEDPFGGISYYRLIQTDFDGTSKVYGPVSVTCGNLVNGMIVFPNPAEANFTVEISSAKEMKDATIQLLDVTGKLVSTRVLQVVEGKNQISYEGLDLQMGTYILKLVHKDSDLQPVKVVLN